MIPESKKANISMVIAKLFAGLNMNGLKYLLPLWMSALTGVTVRCAFAAIGFWITSLIVKEDKATWKQRIQLFLLGAIGLYAFMDCFLIGISLTTPISGAIFCSLQPIFVFILSFVLMHEKISKFKILGIVLGFGGALLCILTQHSDDLASNAPLGNILCAACALIFAIYLLFEKTFLQKLGMVTIMKYVFLGATFTAIIVNFFVGFDAPLFTDALHGKWHWIPWLVLLFVLIGPTFLNYYLTGIGLRYLKATIVSLYSYINLVVASIASYILGQDRFSWFQIIAMLMICASIYFVEVADKKEQPIAKS